MPHRFHQNIAYYMLLYNSVLSGSCAGRKSEGKRKKGQITGSTHNNAGGSAMRKCTDEEIRNFVLLRAKERWPTVPIRQLFPEHWKYSMTGLSPPLWDSLLLQMNGVTLYLNDLYGSAEDLLRFWKVADRSSCAGISAEVKND